MELDRVRAVADRMALQPRVPVFVVGGTNGKGSTCALLEAVLGEAGYRTGCYTSPHLLAYNERVRVARRPIDDASLCESFAAVEAARHGVALTYFEFGTLAAVYAFGRAGVDVMILEVGLGGRLDAVNVFDADCAVITSIGIDHVEYLGNTRESIGFEKAGIMRAGRPVVVGDADPPDSLLSHARAVGARLWRAGEHFRAVAAEREWRFEGPAGRRAGLPHPALRGPCQLDNAATALAALDALRERLPVPAAAVRAGLAGVFLPGRFQVLPGRPPVILDVAHNPHGAAQLARALADLDVAGRTRAVFAMLADKDAAGVAAAVKDQVDHWYLAPLEGPRGAGTAWLRQALEAARVFDPVEAFDSVPAALAAARGAAGPDDRLVVFGSFHTVGLALAAD